MDCVRADTREKGALRTGRFGSQRLGDALDDFLLRGESIPALGRDDFSRHGDLENSGVAFDQRSVDAELLFQRSRRTGGLGEVASGGAVGDGDHVEAAS